MLVWLLLLLLLLMTIGQWLTRAVILRTIVNLLEPIRGTGHRFEPAPLIRSGIHPAHRPHLDLCSRRREVTIDPDWRMTRSRCLRCELARN